MAPELKTANNNKNSESNLNKRPRIAGKKSGPLDTAKDPPSSSNGGNGGGGGVMPKLGSMVKQLEEMRDNKIIP